MNKLYLANGVISCNTSFFHYTKVVALINLYLKIGVNLFLKQIKHQHKITFTKGKFLGVLYTKSSVVFKIKLNFTGLHAAVLYNVMNFYLWTNINRDTHTQNYCLTNKNV